MLKDNYKSLKDISDFQKKFAKSTGFDWEGPLPVISKLMEEVIELKDAVTNHQSKDSIAEEYGDILFVLLNLANHLQLDPDEILAQSLEKFRKRCHSMFNLAKARGLDFKSLTLNEQEKLWAAIKTTETKIGD